MREPTARETAVLDALCELARPIIRSGYNADSCIASTRITLDALAYFGIQARECPLTVLIFNAEASTLLNDGMTLPKVYEQIKDIPADRPGGPWTIGMGAGTGREGMWAGHLVATVPVLGVVVDLSADQANRPHKNITLAPYWSRIEDPAWWSGQDPLAILTGPDGVTLALDRRAVDPGGYRRSPNWARKASGEPGGPASEDLSRRKRLTGEVIRAVRDHLA